MEEPNTMDSVLNELFDFDVMATMRELFESETASNPLQSIDNETFQNREDLLASVRKTAYLLGYAIVIKKSKPGKYVIIGCDRGGSYRGGDISEIQKKRKTASRLINCPFEIWGKHKQDGTWKVEIKCLLHNHESSTDMSGHPSCRKFLKEEISSIKEMTLAGIPPRQILSSLRQKNPNLQAISKNVYNAKIKIRKESLLGRTMVEALLEELGQGGFTYNMEYDQEKHLSHLFFAHPSSIVLTKNFSSAFVMDCTYKTNRYNMPLLDIIGVSSFNTSFFSCFVFLQKEEQEDYVWALTQFSRLLGVDNYPTVIVSDRELALMNAISIVFPKTANLLCVWHIEKNILSNCKEHFENELAWVDFMHTWTSLIQSTNEVLFNEVWHQFEVDYKDKVPVVNYIKNTWLPHKKKFIRAWTDDFMHFGNRVSSRAEGAHSTLKKYLQVSTGDLREVKDKICLAIDNQFHEIKTRLSSEKMRIPHRFRITFFKDLVSHVSLFALDALFKQYELAIGNTLSPLCTGHFSKSMGLPCAHMMREMDIHILQLIDVHEQWRIDIRTLNGHDASVLHEEDEIDNLLTKFKDKYQQMPIVQKEDTQNQLSRFLNNPLPLILEPNIKPHKGRPVGSKKKKGNSSTRRDPSEFEIVEKTRKCSSCKGVGHNKSTCHLRVEASRPNPPLIAPNNIDGRNGVQMIDLNELISWN